MFQFTLQNEVCKWPVLMGRPIRSMRGTWWHPDVHSWVRLPGAAGFPEDQTIITTSSRDEQDTLQRPRRWWANADFPGSFPGKPVCLSSSLFFMCTSRVHLNESKYDCSTRSGPGCCRTPVHSCCTRLITVSINSCCPEESHRHLKSLDYLFYP